MGAIGTLFNRHVLRNTLGTYPTDEMHIVCFRCKRSACYHVPRLIWQHGKDAVVDHIVFPLESDCASPDCNIVLLDLVERSAV
jgi:hypothetical protein